MVIGLIGILKAGGAYVPLDPTLPKDRLAYVLEDARVSVLVTRAGGQGTLLSPRADIVDLDDVRADIARYSVDAPPRQVEPHHLAYVIYTSGSTGRPKGVAIPHRALVNFLTSMARRPGLSRDDVQVAATTISFDAAGLEIYLPLMQGARLVVAEDQEASDGARLTALLQQSAATVAFGTPATWRLLLASGWQGNQQLTVLCGGEALPGRLAEQLLARSGSVWNLYGPTETTIWSTIRQLENHSGARRDPVEAIGRPIGNTEIFILDRYLRPVPLGVPGDLYIGGDGLAQGYHHLPELTAEKFVPHPFSDDPGRRIYKTGDTARYRDDGDIEYLGRTDQQLKLRGFRIELGEIESVLASHPDVAIAVVDARDDHEGDKRLVAWYVSSSGEDLPVSGLREYLKTQLPDYMLPSRYVRLPALPLTGSGKVDRNALTEPDQESGWASAFEPPRTECEITIARMWGKTLGVARVGANDNFFDLGGHSLKAAAFVAQLQKETAIRIDLVDVFRHPTVSAIASVVERRGTTAQHGIPVARLANGDFVTDEIARATGPRRRELMGGVIAPATAEELEMLNE
jgi:amino acid adenylation domain-containing protein